jgi:hypothetical protein
MNSVVSALLVLALLPLQGPFVSFTYCHEYTAGAYEKQCVDLKPDGTGQSRIKRRGSQETSTVIKLSDSALERVVLAISATRNLEDRQKYESRKKVANLGRKQLVLELPSEKREAEFNYSDLKEVNTLATLLDAFLNQQVLISNMEIAAQYERLSIPERLEDLQSQLKIGRIGDPQGLIPLLDKLIQNERILEYARDHARQLKAQIIAAK